MHRPADVTDPIESPEAGPRGAVVVAVAVAFLVPWATVVGGPAWWSTTVTPVVGWLSIGVIGTVPVIAGGRFRRIGTALIAGDALGVLLFLMSIAVVGFFTYGRCGTCG